MSLQSARSKGMLSLTLVLASLLLTAATFADSISTPVWWLNQLSHPRPHITIGLLFTLLVGTYFYRHHRYRFTFLLLLLPLGINIFWLLPYFLPNDAFHSSTIDRVVVISHLNSNRGEADLSELIGRQSDILFLQEVTPAFEAELEQLEQFEIVKSLPLDNTHGSALLVAPETAALLIETDIIHLPDYSSRPLMTALFQIEGEMVHILSLHTTRPRHQQADAFQKIEFEAVSAWSKERQALGEEVLIIGDFNTTPWSHRHHTFLEAGQLTDSMLGHGIQNSWPAPPFQVLGIPIDSAAHSDGIIVVDRQTTAVKQSDHAQLTISFALQR